ncbi:UNVERIFIED_CONTAM: hypothetical protein Scaly_3145600 [Sesamum calycinum]|uniref:Reverse transcriptase zinc-binding domain-containing protein n=1 Tax=Sesamum calycinum TaxID=2727403 RepID=A0AAW2JHH2_9LAMI
MPLSKLFERQTFSGQEPFWGPRESTGSWGLEKDDKTEACCSEEFFIKALQHGHWNWPNHDDPDISEIVSQLPPVHQNSPDTIIWRHASGQFSVKSATELIRPPTDRVVWHGLLQGRYKIPRHNFILWLAILRKLSTLDKHWISHGDNGCVLCAGQHVESHDHLFFNCLYTRRCLQIVQNRSDSTGLSRAGNNASNGLVKDGDLNT